MTAKLPGDRFRCFRNPLASGLSKGATVYLLAIELRGPQGQTLRCVLPCPNDDLTRWLAASQKALSHEEFHTLVRANPTLFLMAVSRAVDCSNKPIESMIGLLSRLDHCIDEANGLDTVIGHVAAVSPENNCDVTDDVEIEASICQFRKHRNAKKLVKSLSRFIRRTQKAALSSGLKTYTHSRLSKSEVRRFLTSLFSPTLTLERSRPQKTPFSQRDTNADAVIAGLLGDRSDRQSDFETRLRDAKLNAMKQLAYGASHEINNPLANIATRAQSMLANESEPDRRFQLAVIYEQSMRAHDMISDMMLFAHPPKLTKRRVDVRLMLSRLVSRCRKNMECLSQSKIQINVTVAHDVSEAMFDAMQFSVAIESLVQNAAEASGPDSGSIEIRVEQIDDQIVYSVSDEGRGVDEAIREHLFDPFFSGREAGRGLGFGLSKAWRIAQLHGGSLSHRFDATSSRTVFELRIPHSP